MIYTNKIDKIWWESLSPEWQNLIQKNINIPIDNQFDWNELVKLKYFIFRPKEKQSLNHLNDFYQLENLVISSIYLSSIEGIANLNNLNFLSLYAPNIQSLEPLQFLPQLKKLIVGNFFLKDFSVLNELKSLTELDLSPSGIRSLKIFEGNNNIRLLKILKLKKIKKMNALKTLHFQGATFPKIEDCPNLTEIYIRPKYSPRVDFSNIRYMEKITKLKYDDRLMTTKWITDKNFPNLQEIHLECSAPSEINFSRSGIMKNVTSLLISTVAPEKLNLDWLTKERFPKLKYLSVPKESQLSYLPELPNLKSFYDYLYAFNYSKHWEKANLKSF